MHNSKPKTEISKSDNFENEINNELMKLLDRYKVISPLIHKIRLDCKNYIYSKCLNRNVEL